MSALIPTRVTLAGMPVTVDYFNRFEDEAPDREDLYDTGLLLIDTTISPVRQEQMYFQELAAYIFLTMGETETARNEKFLGVFSKLLHQSLRSVLEQQSAREPELTASTTLQDEAYWQSLLAYCDCYDLTGTFDDNLHVLRAEFLGDPLDQDDECNFDEFEPPLQCPEDDDPDCDEYYARTADLEPWTEIADCWQRSNDEGWYYGDDD